MITRRIFHFHNAFTTKNKLLIFDNDNKQMVKTHTLLGYYSFRNSYKYSMKYFLYKFLDDV